MAENGSGSVAQIGVNELSGYDSVTEEGLAWGLSILSREEGFESRTICEMRI